MECFKFLNLKKYNICFMVNAKELANNMKLFISNSLSWIFILWINIKLFSRENYFEFQVLTYSISMIQHDDFDFKLVQLILIILTHNLTLYIISNIIRSHLMHQSMCRPTLSPVGRPRGFWQITGLERLCQILWVE